MQKNHLAVRVTCNSIGMILVVYVVMQVVAYFRDNAILGITTLADLAPYVINFIVMYVLPPMIVCGGLLYLFAKPLERTLTRLRAGETIDPITAERTRLRILGFAGIIYALNIVGFVLGYVILVLIEDGARGLLSPYRMLILLSNLAGSCVFAASQSSLSNIAFGELRDRLNLREIGNRRREVSQSARQVIVGVILVVYALTFVEFNAQILSRYEGFAFATLATKADGDSEAVVGDEAFLTGLAHYVPGVLARPGFDPADVIPPWKDPAGWGRREAIVFILNALFAACVALLVHATTAFEVRDQMRATSARLRDVLDGEGDLRKRLTLRAMDEYGEQAELVNRLLSRFHDMAARITSAAAEARDVAHSIDRVLGEAEAMSASAGESVAVLSRSLETEAESSRGLTAALASFREAATAVGRAIEDQKRFSDGTAAAMEEMAANIRSVVAMTGRSGELAGELARRGEEGSGAIAETGEAMREIEASASSVVRVLKSLSKISGDTNLLAMNAAIEAAHAGSLGAGFAVVADEVRKLATNAASETKAIKELMAAMSARVKRGVETSSSTGASFTRLAEGIQQSASISREIEQAMREQGKGTGEVVDAIGQVVAATEAIRSRMDEQDARTGEMERSLSAALDRISRLAESSRAQADAVHRLDASFRAVRAEVDRNIAATGALESALSGLKV